MIPAFASPLSDPVLTNLIIQNEDVRMNADDLAFFLATHGYDVTPEDGCVKLNLDGTVYQLVPNGECQGLANVTASNLS